MVPRLLAAARAMRLCTCADVIQPCSALFTYDVTTRIIQEGLGLSLPFQYGGQK